MSPNAGRGGIAGVSADENSCAHGAQMNFGDLTPYLTFDNPPAHSPLGQLITHHPVSETHWPLPSSVEGTLLNVHSLSVSV
jgi:hypothetical protein